MSDADFDFACRHFVILLTGGQLNETFNPNGRL